MAVKQMSIAQGQRFTRGNPCPVCGGFDGMTRGKDKRCAGYWGESGGGDKWAFCTRVADGAHHEVKGSSVPVPTWAHLLRDEPHERTNGHVTINARPVAVIERELKAVESLSEAARTADEYEEDRDRYDALWAELEAASKGLADVAAKANDQTPAVRWVGLDELSKPVPPVDWICEPLKLAPGICNCIAGYGFSGKTAIAQALLLCLAAGKPLFGLYQCKKLPVGWMDYEQGLRMSAGRMQRQARGMGIDLSALPSAQLRYAEFPDVYLTETGAGVDKIAKAVDGMGLCLMDSARALTPGIDENDSKIRIPFDGLSRVTQKTGCVFVLIHHFGKEGERPKPLKERMRGSSALFDAMQTVWALEAKEKSTFTRCELSKDRLTSQKGNQFGVRFVDNDATDAVSLQHLEPEQMSEPRNFDLLKERIVEAVKAEPGLSANGIYARVTGNRSHILEAIKELVPLLVLGRDSNGGFRVISTAR